MKSADRTQLQQILQHFDDAALVTLANKGLVRRAGKDLQTGGLSHEETGSAICVRGPGWMVTMPPAGPTQATDDSKATGVTRHILAATMYLRDLWANAAGEPQTAPDADIEQALLALSLDHLQKWASKTIVAEALSLVQANGDIAIESHAGLTIRLVQHEVEARILPGSGEFAATPGTKLLDAMMTTASKAQHQCWVIAAIAALHQHRGQPLTWPETQAAAKVSGTPQSRHEVLTGIMSLLQSMTATGLAHPSDRMVQQLHTLSVSATAIHTPRLTRLLRSLADDIALILARDAKADTSRLFDRLCLTHALAQAIDAAGDHLPIALAGQHRTHYTPAGRLQLAGTGAYAWQTASGYQGLTVLFWDIHAKRFRTFTSSRPMQGAGSANFNPRHAYTHDHIWGSGAPSRLCRSRIALAHAHTNHWDRLSATQQTTVEVLAPSDASPLDFDGRLFRDWQVLCGYARRIYPIGLRERPPLERVVVVKPSVWGKRYFDELQQHFVWELEDEAGHVLNMTLTWAAIHEKPIAFLESLKPDRDRISAAIVRLHFRPQGLVAEPLSLLCHGTEHGGVLNPAFDHQRIQSKQSALLNRLRQKFGRDRIATDMTADSGLEIDDPLRHHHDALPPSLESRLGDIEGAMLQLAETGVRHLGHAMQTRLRKLTQQAERAGLSELGQAMSALAADAAPAAHVIRTNYLCRLYREANSAKCNISM